MAAENESPAREPTTSTRGRGRGRGGRGRGRGGGRGASNAGVTKTTAARGGRGGTRRGRAKNFSDSRVQAAYERQRDLKATYQAVAHALKPALQELADRNIEELLQNPDRHKHTEEHSPIISRLQSNLGNKIVEHDKRLTCDLELAKGTFSAEQYVINQEFQNGVEELLEQFYEGQENRLRILAALYAKGLPVDTRDDQYEYKVISDDHLDNDFGIYESYKSGRLVPYPSRVEGTEMWKRARDADAATAAAAAATSAATVTSAPTRGRGRGRGGIKRKPLGEPDGQPTPKRSTRNTDEAQLLPSVPVAPAPAKGLLASAAEADLQPEGTPAEDESPSGTPEPGSFYSAIQAKMPGKLPAREKSPPLPKNIAEPDEHGVRIYNQKPSLRDKGINSRLLAPHVVMFDDDDIGFRDSSNDSTKGHTRAKRGKCLDTPNSNGMHFDHWCNGFDYSTTTPKDFDQKLITRHSVHPKYGIFLPNSTNDQEEPGPYVMPGKPVVFIANPSGRVSHASRSFQKTVNHNRTVDSPWRQKIGASFRRFCKMRDVDPEEISVKDYVLTDEELRERSLGTAVEELKLRPVISETPPEPEQEGSDTNAKAAEEAQPDLSALVHAAASLDAQEATTQAAQAPMKPTKYDAVRDLFMTESKPPPAPPAANSSAVNLNLLAELCNSKPRHLSDWNSQAPAPSHSGTVHAPGPETQAPISNEREASYMPPTPAQQHNEPRMSVETPQRPIEAPPIQPHYQPPRHHPGEPVVETNPYGPIRQAAHPPIEVSPYTTTSHDHALAQQAPPPPTPDYKPPHAYGGPAQEHGAYLPPYGHGGYPSQDPRDSQMAQGRPYDHGFEHRRMSGYGAENPAYSRPYWAQQPPPPSAPTPSKHYSLPPPNASRVPFSQHTSSEPSLPPLRPPRGRSSVPEESLPDSSMRQTPQNNLNPFYSSGSTRPFQNTYPAPETHSTFQSRPNERIIPTPQQPGQSYVSSPPMGYAPPNASPTFGTIQIGGGPPMSQNSPEMAQGQGMSSNSVYRHRSTPSGSSGPPSASADPNSKYRKLQPAPVPAHRAWTNKPELKTIPYDHKDSAGGSAALPNSGPTQIRGWNVNQHRRRNRSDKPDKTETVNEREDSR